MLKASSGGTCILLASLLFATTVRCQGTASPADAPVSLPVSSAGGSPAESPALSFTATGPETWSGDWWTLQLNNLRLPAGVNETLLTPCAADYVPPTIPAGTCQVYNFSVGARVNVSTGARPWLWLSIA